MVSEFRKKKLLELFKFYDVDKNGSIDKRGFELDIKEIGKSRGYQPGDPKYKQVEETMMKIWDGIRTNGDSDDDGKVTAEEWISMWDKFAKNPSSPFEWQSSYCKFVFEILDVNNDGVIDNEEFSTVNESFGISKDAIVTTFQKLSKGKRSISWPQFQELWKEYFASDDPNAAGNSIFCTTTF